MVVLTLLLRCLKFAEFILVSIVIVGQSIN